MPGYNTIPGGAGGGSSGGLNFVKAISLTGNATTWNRAGTSGTYSLFSSNLLGGYAYFIGGTTTGTPLNKSVVVNHAFTSIQIVGVQGDTISLYKMKLDNANLSAFSNPSSAYYQWFDNSLLTSKDYLLGSGTSFVMPPYAMPVADIVVIAGGGGGYQHGPGGGAGGVVYVTAFPVSPTTTYSIGAGTAGNSQAWGTNSTFATLTAIGGAPGHGDYNGRDGGSGSGGAKAAANTVRSGGNPTQTTPTGGRLNFGLGHAGGGSGSGNVHTGGGGGGAGGVGGTGSGTTAGAGGAGWLCPLNGVIYAAGGPGSHHEGSGVGGLPTGTTNAGSGGPSHPNTTPSQPGQNGLVIVRTYG
jgi:hypothetical protein